MLHSKLKTHDQGKTSGEMQCPNCNQPISVTFNALLIAGKLVCTNKSCRTVLRLNRANSGDAITAMKTLKTRLDELGDQR